jgi:hypothetical protein
MAANDDTKQNTKTVNHARVRWYKSLKTGRANHMFLSSIVKDEDK